MRSAFCTPLPSAVAVLHAFLMHTPFDETEFYPSPEATWNTACREGLCVSYGDGPCDSQYFCIKITFREFRTGFGAVVENYKKSRSIVQQRDANAVL